MKVSSCLAVPYGWHVHQKNKDNYVRYLEFKDRVKSGIFGFKKDIKFELLYDSLYSWNCTGRGLKL